MRAIWLFCVLGAMATGACSTQQAARPVEVAGANQFSQPCDAPEVLSDAQLEALAQIAPQDRERQFWAPRDLESRGAALCERQRADALLALIARHNQIIRGDGQ